MRPAGLLFDMDGLILDSERLFMQPFVQKCREEGIEYARAEAFFLSLIGTSAKVTGQRLSEFLPSRLDVAEFEQDWRARYDVLLEQGVPMISGAKDALDHLNTQGVRMAVVTSTVGQVARSKLQRVGVIDYFEVVKAGDEVSANKPHPAPYLEAAEALGLEAHECAAFEDSDLGTQSARAAGCVTYQIPDLRPKDTPLPQLGQRVAPNLKAALHDLGLWG